MDSLWLDDAEPMEDGLADPTAMHIDGRNYDHVVVGAGMTGLVTALLLARAGRSVAVIEARRIGAAATGNTTGKLSLLQGTRLSSISRHHGATTIHDYVEANRAGLTWLNGYCRDRGLRIEERTAVTYATTESGAALVAKEHEACRDAGLETEEFDCAELPFEPLAAIRLTGQAQIDPMVVLRAVVDDVRDLGGELHPGVRVRSLRHAKNGHRVVTDAGTVTAGSVVIATGTPFLDRGGFFARLHAQRSYAAAYSVDGPIPQEMYLSADTPSVSLRTAPRPGHEKETLLLVGGFGHDVGRTHSEGGHVDDMMAWTTRQFPTARLVARWSAQDYRSIDEMPYVGSLLPGLDSVQVATGFAKWGLTNGVAAALAMSGRLLDSPPAWSNSFRPWRGSQLGAAPSALSTNLSVATHMVGGYLALLGSARGVPADGQGQVGRAGVEPRGVCTVEGSTTSVTPICTHLYGVLRWNDAERSWDCPLHGSRFAHTGEVLEGPATRPLATPDD
ncbi:FAD-dependent oxidoreductase [Gordonia sp. SID5947]|uniref:FAD-dependent oxidoreductase n=1 Tax=Gordonia sp. SID5947 TaxID=2690315 RepID=UPI00136CE111|nr:FAD-dependent oxidoreductase [Gordonia sp. SID5947]MYR08204.1 FAD-dependent oxidoreductase [Gordonia sp. SID5947]